MKKAAVIGQEQRNRKIATPTWYLDARLYSKCFASMNLIFASIKMCVLPAGPF
jgi:hypothetical protein